jgi:hypothetical protein
VERAVDVAGPGPDPFGLGALHDGGEAPLVEPQDLVGHLDDDAELVVVLAAGDARAVRGRPDLHEQDRVKVLHVLALPDRTTNLNVENGDSVAHVVLRHPDKNRRKTVIVQPLFKRPFGVEQQNNLGGKAEIEGVDVAFAFEALAAVRDEKGEFLVTVVGDAQEKNFKVKQKHLDDLGLR